MDNIYVTNYFFINGTNYKYIAVEDNPKSAIMGKEKLDNAACSTPKGKRFKISETLICPPPPKKRRLTTTCSLKRQRIEFFAPPELEVFFLCAFTNNL